MMLLFTRVICGVNVVHKRFVWCQKLLASVEGSLSYKLENHAAFQNRLLKIVSVVGYALCRVPVNSMAGNLMKYSYATFVHKFNSQENNYMLCQVQDFS